MAAGIVNALNAALKAYAGGRKVYKRVTTTTGGDALIGRPATVAKTDTLLSPQPLGSRVLAGSEPTLQSGAKVSIGDYEYMCSPDAVTEAELRDTRVSLVLKDGAGGEEVLMIVDVVPTMFNTTVLLTVYARSSKR